MDLEIHHLDLRYAALRVLDPGRVSRLVASLSRDGQQVPVLVAGQGVLVDGYHRVEALKTLGKDLVAAVSLPEVSEADALILSWRLETGHRKSALEEGWLLAELVETHHRSQADLARELRRTRSWVSERIGLVNVLPEAVQAAVREGRVPAQAAAKSLLPMARTCPAGAVRLVTALPEAISSRQVEQIYAAWRQADAAGRQRIEANPMLLLKTERVDAANPPDALEQLAGDLDAITGLCRRARKRWREGVFTRANSPLLHGSWIAAREAFLALEEEANRAGSSDTHSDSTPGR